MHHQATEILQEMLLNRDIPANRAVEVQELLKLAMNEISVASCSEKEISTSSPSSITVLETNETSTVIKYSIVGVIIIACVYLSQLLNK